MTDNISLKELLEEIISIYPKREDFKYSSTYEVVLKEGELLSKEPFTTDEQVYLNYLFDMFRGPARLKSCYETATGLSLHADFVPMSLPDNWTIEYGEGFGLDGNLGIPLPIEHAVFILNGKPVDIVWRADQKKGAYAKSPKAFLKRATWCLTNNEYYMIRMPIRYLEKVIFGKGTYGVIEFNRELIEKGKEAWSNLDKN